jgi:uncharacterized protein (TIGR00106 family)
MIVELSVVPIGVGESLSSYVARAVNVLRKKGRKHQINPMGTVFEVESFRELGDILNEIRNELERADVPRIYFVIKVDYRKKATDMEHKVEAVERILKEGC